MNEIFIGKFYLLKNFKILKDLYFFLKIHAIQYEFTYTPHQTRASTAHITYQTDITACAL